MPRLHLRGSYGVPAYPEGSAPPDAWENNCRHVRGFGLGCWGASVVHTFWNYWTWAARAVVDAAGHEVTVLAREPRRFRLPQNTPHVRIVQGDLLQPESIKADLTGFDAGYYLVHSMMAGHAFESRDEAAAANFAAAAPDCRHVIYLGGLQPPGVASRHLSSRAETGQVLAKHFGNRVTEFRAGPIIGSGSASFEMVRYLSERLPIMITPRWVRTEVSPIAVSDVLAYLSSALDHGPAGIVEIGMTAMPFLEMMQEYASVRGLRRRQLIITPLLAPQLAARWVGFVTPIPNKLAVPLVEGMTQPLRADTTRAEALFPQIQPLPYAEAIRRALTKLDKQVILVGIGGLW